LTYHHWRNTNRGQAMCASWCNVKIASYRECATCFKWLRWLVDV